MNSKITTNAVLDPMSASASQYSLSEERANAWSHGLGVVLGIWALFAMLSQSQDFSGLQTLGITVYGISIITLFAASTLYHSSTTAKWQKIFKMADHCAIYLLIAGTYTPLMLISIQSDKANIVLSAIWALAIGGIIFKTLFIGRFKAFSVCLYLAMGWLCVTVMPELYAMLTTVQFGLLLGGGLLYSIGVIFYVNKRIPFNHAIWHLFVLAAALTHFFCIYLTL
ncbi:hemolysin III family protein [Shewanella maritima]|uniref:PAQR family membrane homeostasis protein TrhA n=1 Tax=Shewanella maritima TaxID=2520507 RepID=UPI003735AC09